MDCLGNPFTLSAGSSTTVDTQPLWDTWSNDLYPTNLRDAFYWADYLRARHGDITSVLLRAVAYFLNGVELSSGLDGTESRDHFTDALMEEHGIMRQILSVGLDLQFYGNVFTTTAVPIIRTIRCPKCGTMRYIRNMKRGRDYDYSSGNFSSKCSSCKFSGVFIMKDLIDRNSPNPLIQMNWDPKNISIDYCGMTGAKKISYTPDAKDKEYLNDDKSSVALETLPELFLRATTEDRVITFNSDSILHLSAINGASSDAVSTGWGVPKWLTCFKYVVQAMMLDLQTEASVRDQILPLRLLFPDPGTNAPRNSGPLTDQMGKIPIANLAEHLGKIIQTKAAKQSSLHMVPTAVQSLTIGGDGRGIVPVEIQQYNKEQLLDSLNVPVEFYKSRVLGLQADRTSMQMFEQTWGYECTNYDHYLKFYLKQCSALLGWPLFRGKLQQQSVSADPARMAILAELHGGGKLSDATFYRAMRIDARAERDLLKAEQLEDIREQQELQEQIAQGGQVAHIRGMGTQQALDNAQMQAEGQGQPQGGEGAPPVQGGAPMGGGGPSTPGAQTGDPFTDINNLMSMQAAGAVSLDQLQADAQMVAQILFPIPPGSPERKQIYTMLRQQNFTLYSTAKSMLDQLDQQASTQGLNAARQGQI